VSSAVIPVDNPTVPKADTTSNAKGKKGAFSVIVRIKRKKKIRSKLTVEMANDLTIMAVFILLPNRLGS